MISNLISNAIKYADLTKPEPCVAIKIDITQEEATIIIEDNGIGIEQEQLNKVFEIFFRGSAHSHGSGLGLYIVKEIVDKFKRQPKSYIKARCRNYLYDKNT